MEQLGGCIEGDSLSAAKGRVNSRGSVMRWWREAARQNKWLKADGQKLADVRRPASDKTALRSDPVSPMSLPSVVGIATWENQVQGWSQF